MEKQENNIDNIIAKYLTGKATNEEVIKLQEWVEASSENKKELEALTKAWVMENDSPSWPVPDTQKLWDKKDVKKLPVGQKLRFSYLSIAASIAIILCITWLLLWLGNNSGEQYYSTKFIHSPEEIILDDGTHVWLSSNTELWTTKGFGEDNRMVRLKGEAYFDVYRDESSPFLVEMEDAKVTVLGTEFSLRKRGKENQTELYVAEGKVAFGNSLNESIELVAGESAIKGKNEVPRKTLSNPNFISWKTGKLVFEKASLKEVAQALERHYQISILLGNNNDSVAPLTSTFNRKTEEEVMKIIEATLDIRILKKNKEYHWIVE